MKLNKVFTGLVVAILILLVINNVYLLVKVFQLQKLINKFSSQPAYGLEPGSIVPEHFVSNINGFEKSLHNLLNKDNNLLLFFSPDCPACLYFLPEIDKFSNEHETVNILVFSKGEQEQINGVFSDYSFNPQIYFWDEKLANSLRVIGTPFIYLISDEKEVLASGPFTTLTRIEQLVSN